MQFKILVDDFMFYIRGLIKKFVNLRDICAILHIGANCPLN